MGREDASRLATEFGRELRIARRAAGVSQATLATRAAMSDSQLSRLERGRSSRATLDQLCRAARAAELRPSLRLYPTGVSIRDHAQLALLGRLEAVLAPPLRLRREVPIPLHGDPRAWDGRITDGRRSASIEGESKIVDAQSLQRRVEAKIRDDPDAGVVILVLNRTAHNRAVLRVHREAFRLMAPLDGGRILFHLRRGEVPPAGGIVML